MRAGARSFAGPRPSVRRSAARPTLRPSTAPGSSARNATGVAETVGTVGVLDASVAVKIVVPETGTTESLAAFERPLQWIAPRLMTVEGASPLRHKVAEGALPGGDAIAARTAMPDSVADGVIRLADDQDLLP